MDETTTEAAPTVGGFGEGFARRRFRSAVRQQLAAELNKRAKKKGATFAASAVSGIVADVTDADIDAAEARATAEGATPPVVGGPILDFLRANPELVNKVVQLLLSLLLG